MHSFQSILFPSLFALAQGHSVILNAQGLDTSPASVGFQGKHHIMIRLVGVSTNKICS